MTVKEFKHDYFSFKGRLNRKPFLMRLMMLGAISIFFVLIVINLLYSADYRQHFARRAPPARP